MAHISGLVAAPSLFEYCDTHTHLMILFVFHTQQASYLGVWAMGRSKSRPGEGVGLVIVCAKQMAHLATNQHNKATSSTKHIQEGLC